MYFDYAQYKQKGFSGILMLVGFLILAGVILFAPLPRYQQTMCNEMDPPTCYPAGWRLSSSLWDELTGKTTQTAQQPIPASFQCKPCSGPLDTSCPGNSSCFVPEGVSKGVCIPVPKPGYKYTIDQVNNMCGSSFSIDETVSSEQYCHQFNDKNCPTTCGVGPSCPVCLDIGCHAKEAHWGKNNLK